MSSSDEERHAPPPTKADFIKHAAELELLASNYHRCAIELHKRGDRNGEYHAAITGAAAGEAAAQLYFAGGQSDRVRSPYELAVAAAHEAVACAAPNSGMWITAESNLERIEGEGKRYGL
jgi:hypothetical protein